MNVPDELMEIGCRAWRESSQARGGNWTHEQQVKAILAAVLDRHRRMIADEVRAYAQNIHDGIDGATYAAYLDAADRIERGEP
jgi:hypothetical protein